MCVSEHITNNSSNLLFF